MNSPVSLFLLNHRRKTATTYRRTCATAVGTDDQTPCQDLPPPEDVSANSNLILADLIRELAALWNHADQLVNNFYIQLKQLDQRTDQAKSRLAHLHRRCRTLQLPPTDAASAGSLRRFLSVRNHYQSMKLEDDGEIVKMNYTNLFLPSTRPCYLIKFQQELKKAEIAWSSMYTKKPTQTACVQTDPNETFSNDVGFSVDFCRPRDRRKSSFSADPPLPTPEQQAQQLVALCKPITLEINANGRACPAGNNMNTNQHKVSEFSEKSTFGRASQAIGLSRLRLRSADGFSINMQSNDNEDTYTGAVQQTVDLFECSAAKEYLYDFAPFYRRRTERLGGMKQFLSLRRPKKIHALHSTEKSANSSTDEYKSKPSDRSKAHFDIASISKFFKRSFSFRSAPSKPAVCVDKPTAASQSKIIANGTENFLETIEESQESSRQICLGKPKTSIPISTTSQVMNLATLLRRSSRKVKPQESAERNQTAPSSRSSKDSAYMSGGERKARVVSFLSAESNTSLEVSDKKHASTYRVGFKLNYPEECKISNNNFSIANSSNIQPQHLMDLQRLEHTSQWVPGSPSVNSNCSAIDSNYSCDHEGYFTSMHHDSGLPLPSYNCEAVTDAGRGRSFSTHSSASTLADGAHLSPSDSSSATTPPASSFFPHVSIHSSPCMHTRTTAPQYMPHSIYVNSSPKVFSTQHQPFCSENPYVFGPQATMNLNNPHLQMKSDRIVPFMQCSGCRPLNSLSPARYLHLPSPLEANHIPQPTDFYYVQRNHFPFKEVNGYQQLNGAAALQSAVKNGEAWGMPNSQVFSCAQMQDNYGMYRPVENRTESSVTCCSNSQIPDDDKMDPFDRWLVAKFCVEQQEAKLKEAKLAERAKLAALTCQKAKKTSGACLDDNYKNCKIDVTRPSNLSKEIRFCK